MGLNPGGSHGPPLSQSVQELPFKEDHDYLDAEWSNRGGRYAAGQAPLQKRSRWLLERMGYNLRKVLTTNLIFMQSRDASTLTLEMAETCWPVHELMLQVIRPKIIICNGNSDFSAYGFLRGKMLNNEEQAPAGHGNLRLKSLEGNICGLNVRVVGVPHMSRYSPIGKPVVVNWITRISTS